MFGRVKSLSKAPTVSLVIILLWMLSASFSFLNFLCLVREDDHSAWGMFNSDGLHTMFRNGSTDKYCYASARSSLEEFVQRHSLSVLIEQATGITFYHFAHNITLLIKCSVQISLLFFSFVRLRCFPQTSDRLCSRRPSLLQTPPLSQATHLVTMSVIQATTSSSSMPWILCQTPLSSRPNIQAQITEVMVTYLCQ